jgi:hypothetical protein
MTAANPGLFTAGTGMESKYTTIMMVPEELRPKTILSTVGEEFDAVKSRIQKEGISYPLIAKPDIGYRGLLVKKIKDEAGLKAYLDKYPLDFLVQELIDYKEEAGIHFHRFPGKKGKITSITLKKFLTVTGDGVSSVLELVHKNDRASLQLERLEDTYAETLKLIPERGEVVPLGSIGNHSKGTTFINGNDLIDPSMVSAYEKMVDQLEGIHYCRFDIKCKNLEDMKSGQGIKVIEINGIGAEPTHIYDPTKTSFLGAVRTIGQHWNVILKISMANNRLGIPYFGIKSMIKTLLNHRTYIKNIKGYSKT